VVRSLSDGALLSVPVAISPQLLAAPRWDRHQWWIVEGGHAIAWFTAQLQLQLNLEALLENPEAIMLPRTNAESDERPDDTRSSD
jgi:hypothetical protein